MNPGTCGTSVSQQYSLSPLCWLEHVQQSHDRLSTIQPVNCLQMADSSRSSLSLLIISFSFLSLCYDSLGCKCDVQNQGDFTQNDQVFLFCFVFSRPMVMWATLKLQNYSSKKLTDLEKITIIMRKIIPHVDKTWDVELVILNPIKHTTAR